MFKPALFNLRYQRKVQHNSNVYSFYFTKEDSNDKSRKLDFNSGQYIRLFLPHNNVDNYGTSRFFTISSTPFDDYLTITTRIGNRTFKNKLNNLVKDEIVQVFGPIGHFKINDTQVNKELIFISGGLGITPFYSMIRYVNFKKLEIPITLFASFKTKANFVFFTELNEITRESRTIKVIYTATQIDNSWGGEKGRVTYNLINKYVKIASNSIFYLTGSEDMVDDMYSILNNFNIDQSRILSEKFIDY